MSVMFGADVDSFSTNLFGWAAVVTAIGTIIVGTLTVWIKRDSKAINEAVNNREPAQPYIKDDVREVLEQLSEHREEFRDYRRITDERDMVIRQQLHALEVKAHTHVPGA
jgi:shikimate kinase